ncbi:CheR family methyltransferase [Caballeronia sp. LZ032]|uniref:CheR family methyltransferase n=1 Tax=Caballeronia sp. LZ032 TaxID=3038565 RepID=UPI002854FE7C|nr:CheR family methyltransferase [Caballeronia sp. LZ032]MDR5879813.1 CheR family methyltransferase [Caballeronia sp. LZ032]
MTSSGSQAPASTDIEPLQFAVVGMGASAGGIEALLNFFDNAPAEMDMAFVVIVHLPADHMSFADEVLQRVTDMPVRQVTGPTTIEKNHIYINAPGRHVEMTGTSLQSVDRAGKETSPTTIDHFFATLASEHGTRSVGIVLSGAGSDGAAGLSRIKESGGMTVAQKPEDAHFAEMPQHAISTRQVDFILPAAEMPEKLLDLWTNAKKIHLPSVEGGELAEKEISPVVVGAERALSDVLMQLRVRTGHDFRHYKRATILRRIERRMQVNGLRDIGEYREHLRAHPDETTALLADMLIGVTQFFRDRDAFDALRRDVMPHLLDVNKSEAQIRVWVPGCSTGEEAYSLAIMLAQAREIAGFEATYQIFATDIDEPAIAQARSGSYLGSIASDVPNDLLRRYFKQEGGRYQIVKSVRERILFAAHSLLRDPPFSHLDLISCRNVLIYLDRAVQRQVLELFHFALRAGGYLFLGTAESADTADDLFTIVDKKSRIYRARTVLNRVKPPVAFPSLGLSNVMPREDLAAVATQSSLSSGPETPERRSFSFAALHQRVLEEYAPPSVVVDRDSNIVHLSTTAGRFLRHGGGELSSNIMALVLPELRLDLRTTLFRAHQTGGSVEARRVKLLQEGRTVWVNMTVRPFHDTGVNADFFLVLFDEVQEHMADGGLPEGRGQDPLLMQLERELQHTREQLATTIEQHETTVEELKASNEELQAINEELRSATEELESSKEELQSVNEELTTVNAELQARVEDTAKANDDLQNIIASTEIATVFVDKQIRVKRFTTSATRVFKLIDVDVGRSLFDITHSLRYSSLADDVKQAFETLKLIEREVESSDGKWYLMRLLPYRTADDRIDGAVLTLIDITARHLAEESARIGEQRLRLVAQSTNDYAIILQDPNGVIVTWNAGAERIFGFTEREVVGKNIALIYDPIDRKAHIPAREREVSAREGRADDDRWHITRDERRVYCSGVVTPISDPSFTGFAKIVRDLTERKLREDANREALAHEHAERKKETLSNQLKDDFIAVLSHELKHPLNLIGMKAEILPRLPETRGIEVVREAADSIKRAVRGQAQIIDDLLDLSRVRTGKLALSIAPLDVAAVLARIAEATESETAQRGIRLNLSTPGEPVYAFADAVRSEQIFWNVVSNALKFTDSGGSIDIRVARESDMVRVDVVDTGQGIDPSALADIFEMYRQGGRNPTSSGLGIGLSLAKQLVEMHGGRIEAHSDGVGHGATLSVWLPGAAHQDASPEEQEDRVRPVAGARLLLVDNDIEATASFATLLELEQASVQTVTSAEQALEQLRVGEVDVLISDVQLPGIDGYELIRRVRTDPALVGLKAIAVTAFGRDEDRRAARAAGFDAHLSKPVDLADLLHMLDTLLAAGGS